MSANPHLPPVNGTAYPPRWTAPTLADAVWRLNAPPTHVPHWPLRRELARWLLNTSGPATYAPVVAEVGACNGTGFTATDLTRWAEMLSSSSRNGGRR